MYPYLATGDARRGLTTQDLSMLDTDAGRTPEPLRAAGYNQSKAAVAQRSLHLNSSSNLQDIVAGKFMNSTSQAAPLGSFGGQAPNLGNTPTGQSLDHSALNAVIEKMASEATRTDRVHSSPRRGTTHGAKIDFWSSDQATLDATFADELGIL